LDALDSGFRRGDDEGIEFLAHIATSGGLSEKATSNGAGKLTPPPQPKEKDVHCGGSGGRRHGGNASYVDAL